MIPGDPCKVKRRVPFRGGEQGIVESIDQETFTCLVRFSDGQLLGYDLDEVSSLR